MERRPKWDSLWWRYMKNGRWNSLWTFDSDQNEIHDTWCLPETRKVRSIEMRTSDSQAGKDNVELWEKKWTMNLLNISSRRLFFMVEFRNGKDKRNWNMQSKRIYEQDSRNIKMMLSILDLLRYRKEEIMETMKPTELWKIGMLSICELELFTCWWCYGNRDRMDWIEN